MVPNRVRSVPHKIGHNCQGGFLKAGKKPSTRDASAWLDDPEKVHPCDGEKAYKGFEIAIAICRSAVQRGKIKLPLGPGEPELDALGGLLPDQTGGADPPSNP